MCSVHGMHIGHGVLGFGCFYFAEYLYGGGSRSLSVPIQLQCPPIFAVFVFVLFGFVLYLHKFSVCRCRIRNATTTANGQYKFGNSFIALMCETMCNVARYTRGQDLHKHFVAHTPVGTHTANCTRTHRSFTKHLNWLEWHGNCLLKCTFNVQL